MRITKEQRRENIKAVFGAVIKLSKEVGFASLTMKSIAKEARIGEATIYNYFPKKESLVTGFLDWTVREAIQKTREENIKRLNFTDTFHTLIENHLEILAPAKLFFEESVQTLFSSPMTLENASMSETRKCHMDFTGEEFDLAVERGEFPPSSFKNFLVHLMWDYHVGLLYYWLKDKGESSMRTTELIDLTMKLLDEVLRSDLPNKVYAILHFLFKEHILSKLFDPLKTAESQVAK